MTSVTLLSITATGCRPVPEQPGPEAGSKPKQSVTLRVGVVNDQLLVSELKKLRGEWSEISGGELEVQLLPDDLNFEDNAPEIDLVIFPTRLLGTLYQSSWLRPLRKSVLGSAEFDATDLLPVVRNGLIRYGGETMAAPLSVSLPLLCYRTDIIQQSPPDWAIFDEQALRLAEEALPVATEGEMWAAYLLLVRAAPMAVHRNRSGVLFDPDTMRPRITEAPFVRALNDLFAIRTAIQKDKETTNTYLSLCKGEAGFGIFSPRALNTEQEGSAELTKMDALSWSELPGTTEVYNDTLGDWEPSSFDVDRVPLLGTGGKLVCVTTSSRNTAGAFRLLTWISSPDISAQLVGVGQGELPVRRSSLSRGLRGKGWPANQAAQIASSTEDALSRTNILLLPRIPGIDDYLQALQQEVELTLAGGKSPAEALQETLQAWEAITDQRGRDSQRQAYLAHLNL